MTHICVSNLITIGSDNGLSPGRRQAITRTNAEILLIRHPGTNFRDFLNRNSYIFIQENAFETVICEMAAILCRPQCVLKNSGATHGGLISYPPYIWDRVALMRQCYVIIMIMIMIMACCPFGAKTLSAPKLFYFYWIFGNKFQWILYQNTKIVIQEKQFEYVVYQMMTVLSRRRCF